VAHRRRELAIVNGLAILAVPKVAGLASARMVATTQMGADRVGVARIRVALAHIDFRARTTITLVALVAFAAEAVGAGLEALSMRIARALSGFAGIDLCARLVAVASKVVLAFTSVLAWTLLEADRIGVARIGA